LRERHVATCMGFIADAFAKATAAPQDAVSQRRIHRCLNVLKAFIEEIEGVGSKYAFPFPFPFSVSFLIFFLALTFFSGALGTAG
jgi:hypothetical protein